MDFVYYTYTSDGLRIRKYEYNGNDMYSYTHNYVLDGSKILKETILYSSAFNGSSTTTLEYYYDESGVASFRYNGTVYHYIKNLQGDVIGIVNSTNGGIVVEYTYDAWGNVLSITGELASTVGQINPFRYRGYYYDNETGLYYLNSRYYDPQVSRFINADGIVGANGGLQGYNMFAYCNNNPVVYTDSSGYVAKNVITRDDGFGNGGAINNSNNNTIVLNEDWMINKTGKLKVSSIESFTLERFGLDQFILHFSDNTAIILIATSETLYPQKLPRNALFESIVDNIFILTVDSSKTFVLQYRPLPDIPITNNAVGGGGFGLSGDDIGGLAESAGADGLPGLFSRNWDPESAWKMLGN